MSNNEDDIIKMFNLASKYYKQKDYDNSNKYYLMAIGKGCHKSMHNIGTNYYEQKDYDKMIKYYLMAKEKGNNYKNIILEQFEISEKLTSLRPSKKIKR